MRVCFYTLGCKVNQNETGALAQLFEQNGFTVVEEKRRCGCLCGQQLHRDELWRPEKAANGCAAPNAKTPAR